MRRHWFPKPYADFVARLRVPGGFLLAAAFLWLSAPTPASLVSGLPVSVLGLVLRAWAAGHLAKNEQLATGGPYAWVRNPLYLGTLVVAAGLSIAARSYGLAVLFAATGSAFSLRHAKYTDLPEKRREGVAMIGCDNISLFARRPADFHQRVRPLLNIGGLVEYQRRSLIFLGGLP